MLERIIKYLLYISLFLPLVFVNYTMYPWNFGKTIYFQILVDVLLIIASMRFVRLLAVEPLNSTSISKRSELSEKGQTFFRKFIFLDWLVLAFLASQAVSALIGVNFEKSFWSDQSRATGIFTWIHFTVFYFLLRQFLTSKKDWINAGSLVVFVGLISTIVAWASKYTSIFEGIVGHGGRISGIIGGSLFLGTYLVIPLFLAFIFYFWLKNEENRKFISENKTVLTFLGNKAVLFFLISGVILLISLIFTFARGAILGTAMGALILWFLFIFTDVFSKKTRKIFLFIGIFVLVIFSTIYIINQKTDFFYGKSTEIGRLLDIRPSENTAATRIMAWSIAFEGWKESPILGVGPENYQDVFDKYYNPSFLKYSFSETVWDKPHNYFMEVLSTQGIIGVSIYIAIILSILFYLKNLFKKIEDRNIKISILFLVTGIIAYVVQLLFLFETVNSLQLWFLLLAFIAFLYEYYLSKERILDLQYSVRRALISILIVFSVFAIYQNYLILKSSYYMSLARDAFQIQSTYWWEKYAEKAITEKSPLLWDNAVLLIHDMAFFDGAGQLKGDTLSVVAPKIESVLLAKIKKYPDSYFYHFGLGQLYTFMGEYMDKKYFQNADEVIKRAMDLSPVSQNAPLLLAKSYLIQERGDDAIKVLEDVANKNPDFPEPHWFLGVAYAGKGEKAKALEEMRKGERFAFGIEGNVLYVIDLYLEDKNYRETVSLYQQLIKLNSNNAAYYHDLAIIYIVLGDYESATKNFQEALSRNPNLKAGIENFLKQYNIKLNIEENKN